MSAPEHGFWADAATWIAGAAASLVGAVWGEMKHRVGKVETGLSKKADKDEMDRQRDNVDTLFEKLEGHARRSDERFTEVVTLINDRHLQIMSKLDTKQDKRR